MSQEEEQHARTQDGAAQEQGPCLGGQDLLGGQNPLGGQGPSGGGQDLWDQEREAMGERLREAQRQAREAQVEAETWERAFARAQAKVEQAQEAIAALEGEMRELVGENRGLRAALGIGPRQERGGAT